jgi:hypothetical protein
MIMWVIFIGTGTASAPFVGVITLRAVQRAGDRIAARHWQTVTNRNDQDY